MGNEMNDLDQKDWVLAIAQLVKWIDSTSLRLAALEEAVKTAHGITDGQMKLAMKKAAKRFPKTLRPFPPKDEDLYLYMEEYLRRAARLR
jgi:hypothetical protein